MAQPKGKAKTKTGSKVRGRRTDKFKLGLNAVIRKLLDAERIADKSIATGEKRVAQTRGADASIVKKNAESLAGAKAVKLVIKDSLKRLADAPCLDHWMNSDPEFFAPLLRNTKGKGSR